MNLVKSVKSLCMPASLYLGLSVLALLLLLVQNMSNKHTLCVANYSCPVANVTFVLLMQLLYVLFWTWILNLICKSGYKWVSWVLVLFPFVAAFLFVLFGMTRM